MAASGRVGVGMERCGPAQYGRQPYRSCRRMLDRYDYDHGSRKAWPSTVPARSVIAPEAGGDVRRRVEPREALAGEIRAVAGMKIGQPDHRALRNGRENPRRPGCRDPAALPDPPRFMPWGRRPGRSDPGGAHISPATLRSTGAASRPCSPERRPAPMTIDASRSRMYGKSARRDPRSDLQGLPRLVGLF